MIKVGTKARDYYPEYVEGGNVYQLLADAYQEKGDKKAATLELEKYSSTAGATRN